MTRSLIFLLGNSIGRDHLLFFSFACQKNLSEQTGTGDQVHSGLLRRTGESAGWNWVDCWWPKSLDGAGGLRSNFHASLSLTRFCFCHRLSSATPAPARPRFSPPPPRPCPLQSLPCHTTLLHTLSCFTTSINQSDRSLSSNHQLVHSFSPIATWDWVPA